MRKITVRIDDVVCEAFASFCAGHGTTMTSMIHAMIEGTVEGHYTELVERARLLDHEKRSRRGPADPAP